MPARRTLEDWNPLPAERRLAEEMASGLPVMIGDGTLPPENLPATDPRVLRTSFLRALILGQIEDHPPHEKGVRVHGAYIREGEDKDADSKAFDLSGCDIKQEIELALCRVVVPVRLNMAKLVSLHLNRCRLTRAIEAKGLVASGGLLLRGAEVSGTLDLLGARLAGSLDASEAVFYGYDHDQRRHLDVGVPRIIDMRGLQVGGGLRLPKTRIEGVLDLTGADVRGDLRLNHAHLRVPDAQTVPQPKSRSISSAGVVLDRVSVSGNLQLEQTSAHGGISCRHAQITGDLVLCGGAYGEGRSVDTTRKPPEELPIALDLHGTKVGQRFRFRDRVEVNGKLDLGSMRVELFDDARCSWPAAGGLILDRISIGGFAANGTDARLRSAWLNRMSDDPFTPQPWEECARVLREMGHGAAARDILIEKEKRQRKARRARVWRERRVLGPPKALWLGFWDWVLGWSVRYGRQPLRAFLWLAVMWGIGWGVFAVAEARGDLKPNLPQVQRAPEWVRCGFGTEERRYLPSFGRIVNGRRAEGQTQFACFLDEREGWSYPRFVAWVYSADTLMPVVSFEMQSYWIPDDAQPFGALARAYLWFHIAAGWALTLLAVAGFSGLIRTDNTK